MYLIPLTQIESVELVIHALRAAGGQADCSTCPAHKVCMQQCLSIADAVQRMLGEGSLPNLDAELAPEKEPETPTDPSPDPSPGGHLKRIK
ncbi:hypothetical protein [Geothermobacter hydrogeniphilus]|uniref:Radical SAM additional 4Fe4S-binding SPASM domain-containing protein n=1 Tax=Geothermobacter hydrogeniphilus TaxID=1969733 RepID=A0A1X0YA39_9BACT|nr:hypothetical protein [Geothermobacter hydrogeniphilus]ORJ62045.1 hypothetical protein B5V00_04650 [Geothermobacter hydrogeniphilus]